MHRAVAETALWTAAARARESRRPDRLFDDPLAGALAGPRGTALLAHFHTDRAAPEGNPFLAIRTRWFDDVLTRVPPGYQVVGLGAGLDTRAYRLAWPADTVLYEVDQPDLLAYKADILARVADLGSPRCDCRRVPANLAGDWISALLTAGFDPSAPAMWFAEGVLFYLPEPAARAVTSRAAASCVPGSRFAADLIGTGIFRFPYTQPFLRKLAKAGSPWRFGTDDPAGFVESCGWRDVRVAEPGGSGADYGRWPAAAAPAFPDLPRSFLVSAALSAA